MKLKSLWMVVFQVSRANRADQRMHTFVSLNKYNMGLINKVDMVCLSPVGYGV